MWNKSAPDAYTRWTSPDEKEKIEKTLRRPNSSVATCPVCFQEIEYKVESEFKKHQAKCSTERERKIREQATIDAMRMMKDELREQLRKEILAEVGQKKKPGRKKKEPVDA